ncbi:MAG: hypothetical protein ACRDGN_16430, partial [bacterium]
AWRHKDRLSAAHRALLVAYLGPRFPRRPTLAELIAAGDQAALAAPEQVEAWYIVGANYLSFGSIIGYPGWEARAAEALARAFALDSTHGPTLDLLLLLAAGARDREAVRRYAAFYLAHNPTAERAGFLRWLAATVLGDSAELKAVRRRFDQMPVIGLRSIVLWSQDHGTGLEDAERAAQFAFRRATSTPERSVALQRLVTLLLNRGRPDEASPVLATGERIFGTRFDVGTLEFQVYAALYWDGDSVAAAAAARRLDAYVRGALAHPPEVRDRHTANCALAHWHIAARDFDGARAALGRMRRLPAIAPGLPSPESRPVCVAALEAELAAVGRESNAATALDRLDQLLRAGSQTVEVVPTVANLIAARLFENRGDLARALDATRRQTHWNWFLSTQLREEGRLAASSGDRGGAIRAYEHYLTLRSGPEPRLQPDVERVRAELRRLKLRMEEGKGRTPPSP